MQGQHGPGQGLHHHVHACLNLSIPFGQLLVTCVRACAVSCIAFHVRAQAAAAIFPLNQRLLEGRLLGLFYRLAVRPHDKFR